MKKFILIFATLSMFSFIASAKDDDKAPVSVGRFTDNWFVGAGAGVNTILDNGFLGKTGLGVDLYTGKWLIPAVGVRLGWHGLNNQAIDTSNGWFAGEDSFSFNYLHLDFMWDILNTFRYSGKRIVNPQVTIQSGCIFTDHDGIRNQEFGMGGGVGVSFRITKRLCANIEASAILSREEAYRTAGKLICFPSVSAGIAVNIGKVGFERRERIIHEVRTVEVVKDCGHESQILSLLNQLDSLKAIKPEAKVETVTRPAIVYFDLNKSELSRREKAHLEFLAEHLPDGARLIITGHADKETGNPAYNLRLSERRAKTVAKELEKLGVKAESIDWKGDTANAYSTQVLGTTTNRCCFIQVAL